MAGYGFASNPPLYEAVEVKRQASQRSPLTTGHISFLVRPRVFLRPGHDFAERRAQPSSRLAGTVAARRIGSYPGPRLDDGEPGAKLDGRDDRSRSTTQVILDWAVNDACGNTASPCIRSGTKARYHNPSCTGEGKAQQRRDPSTKRVDHPGWVAVTRLSWLTSAVIARGRSEAWTQHGAGRHHAGLEITPERHHQLAGQRHDGNAAQPSLHVADTVTEPAAEVAAGLVS